MEIEDNNREYRDLLERFQKDIEKGMNLYYDLWSLIFNSSNDWIKLKKFCLEINDFNEGLSKKFNILLKFDSVNNDHLINIYEQYLNNYANDKGNAKILTEKFKSIVSFKYISYLDYLKHLNQQKKPKI